MVLPAQEVPHVGTPIYPSYKPCYLPAQVIKFSQIPRCACMALPAQEVQDVGTDLKHYKPSYMPVQAIKA